MPASIVPIEATSECDDHKTVERELSEAFYDYWRSGDHSFNEPDYMYARFLEGRIRTLETSIRRLVASGVLTESQRTGLLIAAYGSKTGTLKDARLLTRTESRLIENYRRLDTAAGRAAVRGLLETASSKAAAKNGGAR